MLFNIYKYTFMESMNKKLRMLNEMKHKWKKIII